MSPRLDKPALLAVLTLIGVALYYVLVELHRPGLVPANDIYGYFLPNILHALHSVAAGGKGLLWNPLQACGEPFFANTVVGLLYPLHWLFLVFEPNLAVHIILVVNMALGAIGMLLLGRELGLGWPGAFAGALAFQLGDPMAQLTSWSPMHNGPWVWLPWALLFVERLLRAPTRRNVAGLTLAVVLEILPGFILITAFTYQLIAFRVAWELFSRRAAPPWKSVFAITAALTLAPLVLAVQLAPAAEYARESFRVLNDDPKAPVPTWVRLPLIGVKAAIKRLAIRDLPIPFSFGLVLLAGVALVAARTRPVAVFYLLIGTLYGILGFGNATPLYQAFIQLPPGAATLRLPYRFFWLTGFSLSVLAGIAVHHLSLRESPLRARWNVVAMVAAVAVAVYFFIPGGLQWPELAAGSLMLAAVLASAVRSSLTVAATWIVIAAMALNLFALPLRWPGYLLTSTDLYYTYAPFFSSLRATITPQDRTLFLSDIAHSVTFRLMQKTASVFQVPTFHDYEALLGYRYSRYYMAAWEPFGALKRTRPDAKKPDGQHRLLDLAAIRYLVALPGSRLLEAVSDTEQLAISNADLQLRYNERALPRARFVPRIEVLQPTAILERLVRGSDDLRNVAFVESPPASGFLGSASTAADATVRFVANDPEHLEIELTAASPGFVVLADTHFPGWQATVNGDAVPILRANYMFRLVEVPAGESRIVFRYRPTSVMVGACISVAAFIVLIGLWRSGRSRAQDA